MTRKTDKVMLTIVGYLVARCIEEPQDQEDLATLIEMEKALRDADSQLAKDNGRELGSMIGEIEQYRKALQEIMDATPANDHKKWPHQHFYLTKALKALKTTKVTPEKGK